MLLAGMHAAPFLTTVLWCVRVEQCGNAQSPNDDTSSVGPQWANWERRLLDATVRPHVFHQVTSCDFLNLAHAQESVPWGFIHILELIESAQSLRGEIW